jgi:hypothetical protein
MHVHRNIIFISCCVWILCRVYAESAAVYIRNCNVNSCGQTEMKRYCWHRSSNASQSIEKKYQLMRSIRSCPCTKVDVQCGIVAFQHVLVCSMWDRSILSLSLSLHTHGCTHARTTGRVHSFVQKCVFGFWADRPSSGAMSRDSMLKTDQIEEVFNTVTVGKEHSMWGPYSLSCTR